MCVSKITCPCKANCFGDPEDPESLISKVVKENRVKVLNRGKGQRRNKAEGL